MKHLLLVCYFYPPDGGAGTQRPLSIARHAAACGWRVTVLTRDGSHERSMWDPEDKTLRQQLDHVKEIRVPVPEGSTSSQMIAGGEGAEDPWLVACTHEATRLHAADPIDHVLVTMPPYGMAPMAAMIREACPQVPVSIDLRDPWAFDGAFAYSRKALWRQNMSAMRGTLNGVDGVIVNTPEVLKRVKQSFTELDPSRLEYVTNGFEPDLFDSPKPSQPEAFEPGYMHLVHVGMLHSWVVMRYRGFTGWLRKLKNYRAEPVDVLGRTAVPIMQAIGQLNREQYPGIEKLRLVLVGLKDEATEQLAVQSGCSDQVVMTGYMPHDEAVAWQRWADCLFLPLHGLPDDHRSLIVPGKTYEYLASQRPILGAVPAGDAREFLEQSGRARVASPCDVEQLAVQLRQIIDQHASGSLPAGQGPSWAEQYSRPVLTRRLFAFLENISRREG
jgi:glycosyltransferase involved in cell wall biosynthesis